MFLQSFGSRVFVFLLAASITSCGLFKKAPDGKVYDERLEELKGRKVYNPQTGKFEPVKVVTEKMDTVRWTEVSKEDYPPITDQSIEVTTTDPEKETTLDDLTGLTTEQKSEYNIALVLPFISQKFSSTTSKLSKSSKWALNFYAGAQIAMDKLDSEGVALNVTVHDSQGSEGVVSNLLYNNESLKNADLIIGPYRRQGVQQVAEYAKQNNITFLSPYSASANLSTGNPNYLQVSPTLEMHCKSMLRHALRTFKPENIVLVSVDNDVEPKRFEYFQKENRVLSDNEEVTPLKELKIPSNFNDFTEEELIPFMSSFKTTAFLIPSFSNETFVNNFLRMLIIAKEARPVRVYGLPQWMDFKKVDFNHYENLDVHLTSGNSHDFDSAKAAAFKRKFYNRYGSLATEEAYLGHDVLLFSGRMLNRHGNKFQGKMEEETTSYLQHQFEFKPKLRPQADGAEVPPVVEQFENQKVYFLQFKDYQYQQVD